MKKLFTLIVIIALTISVFAQSPQKMSYQAVIRNNSGVLVANQGIGMKISILQGAATGTIIFQEIFNPNPQTNINGLVTVEIGGGIPLAGTFSSINWANGSYFLKTETDPTGGTNYTVVGISQILSVPYAFYAQTAKTANYNDLTNKPWLFDGTWTSLTGKPTFATVATSGSYNDLFNKLSAGTGINIDGTNKVINSAPDQTVTLTGSGVITVTGAYPNFTISGSSSASQVSDANGDTKIIPELTANDDYLRFYTNGVERMNVTNSGNVGIGISTATNTLELYRTDLNYLKMYTSVSGTGSLQGFLMGIAGVDSYIWNYEMGGLKIGTNNLTRMTITSAGNIGIGDVTPEATLDVEGTVLIGEGGKAFSEIREITGTLDADGVYSIPYPSVYNSTNMRVLSLEVNYNGTAWTGIGSTVNYASDISKLFYYLGSTIQIYYPNQAQYQNRAFRMIVMKVQ